ncbi:MAG: ABC transporter permease [Bradyrhizobiaceae bacterium]|nr:ABC transporter permease [Bradyrhizobiaceae bacterium]
MRMLAYILRKEFKQIFRDRLILVFMTVAPLGQLLILPLATDYEVRNVHVAVVDHDHSVQSRALIDEIAHTSSFKLVQYASSMKQIMLAIEDNNVDVGIDIPVGFGKGLGNGVPQTVFMAVNAINGMKANVGAAYLTSVINDFGVETAITMHPELRQQAGLSVESMSLFNPHMDYRAYMVPGILALLLTMIAVYLTALNIVREKEIGTIEQINVTPIKKLQFIAGKLIPFWLMGMLLFVMGLILIRVFYNIQPVGSTTLLIGFAATYLVAVLGLGLLISTIAETQQQAMFISFFFMLIFVLLSGLLTPISSMPEWAQVVTRFTPIRYFIEVMRMVVLKGSTLYDVRFHLLAVVGFALFFNGMALMLYRKTSR